MTEMTASQSESVRVELFLRTQTPSDVVERLRELADRVRRLAADDTVSDVRVRTWTSVQPALEELSDTGQSVTQTVDAFRAWAEQHDCTLRPGFEQRETTSMVSRRSATKLQVPIAGLAVYEGETLQCVAPCSDGDRTYTVDDCVTALETDRADVVPFAGWNRSPRDETDAIETPLEERSERAE